jgi:hypothetical protein
MARHPLGDALLREEVDVAIWSSVKVDLTTDAFPSLTAASSRVAGSKAPESGDP